MPSYQDHPAMIYARGLKMYHAFHKQYHTMYPANARFGASDPFLSEWAPKEAALEFVVRHPAVAFNLTEDGEVEFLKENDKEAFDADSSTHWQKLYDLFCEDLETMSYRPRVGVAFLSLSMRADWDRLRAYLIKFPHAEVSIGARGKPIFANDDDAVHYLLSS
jgi:hypothetical protein